MAEFCRQCAEELDFKTDFDNLFKQNNVEVLPPNPDGGIVGFPALCETCGPYCFIIDDEGTCGSDRCDGSLSSEGKPHGNS